MVPVLLQGLARQDEDADATDWNVAVACASTLTLMSQAVGDPVVELVMPFVMGGIQDRAGAESWRKSEAAIMAFGSCMDGPSTAIAAPLVAQALPTILTSLKDENEHVRSSAAWASGQLIDLHASAIDANTVMAPMMQQLLESLADEPSVTKFVIWTFGNVANAFAAKPDDATSGLSAFFKGVASALLQVTERPDADEHNLRTSAYEVLVTWVQSVAADCRGVMVDNILPLAMQRLQGTFSVATTSPAELEHLSMTRGSLALVIGELVARVGEAAAMHHEAVLAMLISIAQQTQGGAILEEAFTAVGNLAGVMGETFVPHLASFVPLLARSVANYEDSNLCIVSMHVVHEVAAAVGPQVAPFLDGVMTVLLQNLTVGEVERRVKPITITLLGDLAMAVGAPYEKCVPCLSPCCVHMCYLHFSLPIATATATLHTGTCRMCATCSSRRGRSRSTRPTTSCSTSSSTCARPSSRRGPACCRG